MNKSISLTVDTDDYNALTRASDMLHGMAQDIKKSGCKGCIDEDKEKEADEILVKAGVKSDNDNKSLEGIEHVGNEGSETSAADAFATNDDKPEKINVGTEIGVSVGIGGGVELDSQGLPWDVRIHSKNKSKLAKDQSWKKKRGVDAALIVQVEAELRAAMATAPAQVETSSPTTETPAAPATLETPAKPAAPAQTETLTFPDLMGKITTAMGAGTLTQEMIMVVINPLGLASLPLVAARPDLIPEINTALFPNG